MTKRRQRVAIVGGNFAGLAAAIKLPRRFDVTVIDPGEHFEWMPAIHEILSCVKTPQGLRLDRAAIVERAGHRFVRDEVCTLDAAKGRLDTAGGQRLDFDACIVAVGATWNTHHIPGVARHALPFRSVADALAIEQRLQQLVQQGQPLRIVIAGGGLSGIEALGEILRRHRDRANLTVELVESGPRLLPGLPARLDADLRQVCAPFAVNFRTAAAIAAVTPKGVRLEDGTRLRSELTLWTAGLAPPALLRAAGLAAPPKLWADVRPTLQSLRFDNCFVIGDAAALPRAVGKQAYNAIDMGALAAANAQRWLAGRPLTAFMPRASPVLIAFGDLQTYMVAGKTVLASQWLASAKEGIYQAFMSQMEPGHLLTTLPATGGRLWQGWRRLALPQLLSLVDFSKLPDQRKLGSR